MDKKDFLVEFIELYRSYPCLWKVKSQDYSNKLKKKTKHMVSWFVNIDRSMIQQRETLWLNA